MLGLLLLGCLCLNGCTKDELDNPLDSTLLAALDQAAQNGTHQSFILPDPNQLDLLPQDPQNPLSVEKVTLGNLLFFETGVALAPAHEIGKASYSCGSCHVPSAGFLPGRVQGIADGGAGFGNNGEGRDKFPFYDDDELDVQGIRPLSLINVTFATNTTWSGQFGAGGINEGTEALWDNDPLTEINHQGFSGIESQNMEGIDLHRMVYNQEVVADLGYTELFDAAFPEVPVEERYSKKTAGLALSAYIRTLIPTQAPFQQWLQGDLEAMTDAEKNGALLFFGKAGCVNCHSGPALNSMKFAALGVDDLYQNGGLHTDIHDKKNLGRGGFTEREEDMFKFRVPQLYNLQKAGFYFHGSSKTSLREVVEYFNNAIPENENVPSSQISPYFRPLNMTKEEVADLTRFIEQSLYDPNMGRYVPDAVLSGNCIPNNDPFSQSDLGCD